MEKKKKRSSWVLTHPEKFASTAFSNQEFGSFETSLLFFGTHHHFKTGRKEENVLVSFVFIISLFFPVGTAVILKTTLFFS